MKRFVHRNRRATHGVKAEQIATVHIDTIAAGGDGVARIDGLACFVPRTAPGDDVQIAYAQRSRYARGRVLQVVTPSTARTEPRCQHYVEDRCGGCRIQHLTSDAQHVVLQNIVRDVLQRVGHRDVAPPEVVSGLEWGYRERLTLTLRARGNSWVGGLHAFDDPVRVFALRECPVSHPLLVECWQTIRNHLHGLPVPISPEYPLRLSLRIADGDASRVALVVMGAAAWPDASEWAERVQGYAKMVSSVWWSPHHGKPHCLFGATVVAENLDDIAADDVAFAQINSTMAATLRAYVVDVINASTPRSVIDAYAGRGEVSVILASHGVTTTAIESDVAATQRAQKELAAFPHARVVTAQVETVLDDILPSDVVLLNPPRRGLKPQVTDILNTAMERGVQTLVYVSCDPATLARDLARLSRWRVATVRCFDMFPHTAHVETVCVLVPEAG